MNKNNKIVMLGGDLRQYTAAVMLGYDGWDVKFFGIYRSSTDDPHVSFCGSCEEAIRGAKGIILPLPASVDGVYLNCPFCDCGEKPKLTSILELADRDAVIIGGRIPSGFLRAAEEKGFTVKDYFDSEEFQVQNAYITAEAALSIAMNSLEKNICGANIAVTGYGRIAKHLERLLLGLGAKVTIVARKDSDLAWGYSHGCSVLKIGEAEHLKKNIYTLTKGYDVIYNTVPERLFDRVFLEAADKATYIIDLASVPGGVDICAAKELGSNVLWAASLPGKYAPKSAGSLIASCVNGILQSEVIP